MKAVFKMFPRDKQRKNGKERTFLRSIAHDGEEGASRILRIFAGQDKKAAPQRSCFFLSIGAGGLECPEAFRQALAPIKQEPQKGGYLKRRLARDGS